MHKQTKATAITAAVKKLVWERDGQRCVVCRRWVQQSCACSHVIKRSQGGMGIEKNIVTHCPDHHQDYDGENQAVKEATMAYILKKYPDWTREAVTYSKWKK